MSRAQARYCCSRDRCLPWRGPSLPPLRAAWVSICTRRDRSTRRAGTGLRAPWRKSSTARLRRGRWDGWNFVFRDGPVEPWHRRAVRSFGALASDPRARLCEPQQSAHADRLGRRAQPRARAPRSPAARHPPCREARAASCRASRTQGCSWAERAGRAEGAEAAVACSERAA